MNRSLSDIDYPKTAGEWWAWVLEHQGVLKDLIATYHPYYRYVHTNLPITAERAEQIREGIAEEIACQTTSDPQRRFELYLKTQHSDMLSLLNETWWGLPESENVRSEPGFGVLCDLCSEGYVLEPE